jgi:hypothetical protein
VDSRKKTILNLFKQTPFIEFYTRPEFEGNVPEPKPASKFIPDWFKKIPLTIDGKRDSFGDPSMTAKRCLPMLDAMSLGYVIPLACDVHVITNNDCSIIRATNPPGMKGAEFHSLEQVGNESAPGYPAMPIKFINPWIIKTRPGWSTVILPLINRIGTEDFTCLSAVVDTDTYQKEINFPAIWHTPNFDAKLPAGTPLVVVFPIKRSNIDKKPSVRKITDKELKLVNDIKFKQESRVHVYTHELREPRK